MIEPTANFEPGEGPESESWKNQLASRLDTYRSRNKRKLSGEFSMRFNFEGELAGPRQQSCVPALPDSELELPASTAEDEFVLEAETEPAGQANEPIAAELESPPVASPVAPVLPRLSLPFKRKVFMEANVIEFPRLFPPEPTPSMVAESIVPTSPRILDAPEIAGPLLETPFLDGMRLAPMEHKATPELELPLQVASVPRRILASVCDGLLVLSATALFSSIAYKLLGDVAWSKPALGTVAIAAALFWVLYQYMFILYGARTLGMLFTKLALSTFQGTAPNRRERIFRLLGLSISCSSLMLGFLWAFFDEDTLCWHDRISRTYLFRQRP